MSPDAEDRPLRDNLKSEPFSKQFRELEVHYLFGASGAGKTRSIFRKHEIQDICRITDYGGRNGVRFDGYHTQPVLVFEEFHSQIPIESMLNFWDTYPTTLPARYQDKVACYTTVYITSNIPLEAQYPEIQQYDSETWRAFFRRIHTVTQFLGDGTTEVLYDEMVTDGSLRIALTNAAGETPTLLRERRDRENRRMKIWELNNPGIPLKMWLDKQLEIEAAFDLHVIDVDYGKSTSRIILKFVPRRNTLPNYIEWKDEYLSPDSFVLTLGEGYIGPITVDLAMIPHILLGGSIGSGKSVLLKLLLMQSLRKGAEVYITDFKGGVDFPSEWHRQCRMCFEEHDLLELLTGIAEELQRRKQLFNSAACSNLDEYNKTAKMPLKRCVLLAMRLLSCWTRQDFLQSRRS